MKIIFVHFGSKIPKYLELNIANCISMFTDYDVVLLTDHPNLIPPIDRLSIFQYQYDQKWLTVESGLKHSKVFRSNFWFLTIARFLALEQYLSVNPGEIIHIESDVILSRDFPFKKFSNLKSDIAFPLVSKNRGVASTLYIRNLRAANKIVNATIKSIKENPLTTDMEILRNLYDNDPNTVYPLPMGLTPNHFFKESITKVLVTSNEAAFDHFEGIFDGVSMGIFISGIDPRNNRGWRTLRHEVEENYLNVRKIQFEFSKSRNFINLVIPNASIIIPIYSLHIHSKDIRFFSKNNLEYVLQLRISDIKLPVGREFLPTVFINSVFRSLRRRLCATIKYLNTKFL